MNKDNSENLRDAKRRSVIWTGTLHHSDVSHDCQIWNVSKSGAKIRTSANIPQGHIVQLEIDKRGTFTAETVWQKDGGLGLTFVNLTENDTALLDEIVQSLGLKAN